MAEDTKWMEMVLKELDTNDSLPDKDEFRNVYTLDRETKVGDKVAWSTMGGRQYAGHLIEWDNWTAIVHVQMQCFDGGEWEIVHEEKAVQC